MTLAALFIIFNLIVLESLLSVDNAAVLAVMVKDLPKEQQPKALKYGLWGAFFFRGLCLVLASWLIQVIWLKALGGLYLLYLVYSHFTPAKDSIEEGIDKEHSGWFNWIKGKVGLFWSTVILVEIMDLAFSIDNVFAAVAMTDNIYLIMGGVFIGIITMRFVATWFVKLMQKHPSLETSAFIVIAILGVKLILSCIADYIPSFKPVKEMLESHIFDLLFSGIMMVIFFVPLLINKNTSETK